MVFASESVIVTDNIITAAIYAGGGILLLISLLMLQVIVMRIRLLSNQRRRSKLLKKWRPELTQILLNNGKNTVALPASETCVFLEEWNRMFSSIRGDDLNALVRVADKLRIGYFARGMLKSRRMRSRLLAIVTLGHMREYGAWDNLSELLHHRHTILSLTAARALMWIDARNAVDLIIPVIPQRQDWPWSNVANILKQAPPHYVCEKLADAVKKAPAGRQVGMLRLLEATKCIQLTDAVFDVFKSADDDRIASVCMHIITDPAALDIIRKYVSHQRWHVRMHAATALGRLGSENDIQTLLHLVGDEQWWVRYRAAQALAAMPFVSDDDLKIMRDKNTDRFAHDILDQVIAEGGLQ